MSEEELTSTFINGARDLLGVALIIGIARGIVVIMDKGMITHTILHSAEGLVAADRRIYQRDVLAGGGVVVSCAFFIRPAF